MRPPTLLVCINRTAYAHDRFVDNGVLCVNVLSAEHQDLSGVFARYVPGVDRFAHGSWGTGRTGSPLLSDANVAFDCRITGQRHQGTHSVFFCEVLGVTLSDRAKNGLVWFSRDYHHLATGLTG